MNFEGCDVLTLATLRRLRRKQYDMFIYLKALFQSSRKHVNLKVKNVELVVRNINLRTNYAPLQIDIGNSTVYCNFVFQIDLVRNIFGRKRT